MYTPHPDIVEPPDDAVLWRYQSIDKFRSLVMDSALHFARLDKLVDPREGTMPAPAAQVLKEFWKVPDKETRVKHVNALQQQLVAVNCWHWNDYENSLMWGSYARPGLAVKTTFASLKESFRLTPYPVYGGEVRYVNHDKDETNRVELHGEWLQWSMFELGSLKYPSFKGEKEVRLLRDLATKVFDGKTGDLIPFKATASGVFVEVNLYQLLSEVILSPDAGVELDAEVKELIRPINERLPPSRQVQVQRSTLYG